MKAFKYRLCPTPKQEKAMLATLTTCRFLYNNALAERIDKYKKDKTSVSYVDQANKLSDAKDEYQKQVHSQVLQDVLKRLDKSFKNFFDGLKKKVRVGFPRFKPEQRFNSFCYPQSGFRLTNDNKRITLSKIGDVKLKYSRPIEGEIKTCRIIRDVDQWFVVLTCDAKRDIKKTNETKPTIGIDVGIKSLAVLSDGTIIDNPRHLLKAQKNLAKQQRWLSRKIKGSNSKSEQRVKVAKVHRKIRRQRDDFLHKLSTQLVEKYGCIIFEDLNIKGMLKNHCLAKHISDASWNKLIQFTTYKAEEAGGSVKLVCPRYTSQDCSRCGERVPKTLADRTHICPKCGLVMDRDENAAKNICTVGSTGNTLREFRPLLTKFREQVRTTN
jgi:putative transposase